MTADRRRLLSRWRELAERMNADALELRREGYPADAAELETVAVDYTAAADALEFGSPA